MAMLSLRSVWCHGYHVNAHEIEATIIITFDLQAHLIQVHKYCSKWETQLWCKHTILSTYADDMQIF